jgi:hypothetical protein
MARMRVIAAALMLLALATLLMPGRAAAFEVWCADDPIVSVGGRLLDIQVQMPLDKLLAMRSTRLTVFIPQNVPGFVVLDDISAFPMQTTVVASDPAWSGAGPLPVRVVVDVTAALNYPVRVAAKPVQLTTLLAGPTTVTGTANTRIELRLALGK